MLRANITKPEATMNATGGPMLHFHTSLPK